MLSPMRWLSVIGLSWLVVACGGRTERTSDGVGRGVGGADNGSIARGISCADAIPVAVTEGVVEIGGTTIGGGTAHPELTCGSPHVAFTLDQPQIYYRLEPAGSRGYEVRLQPSFYGFLYAFPPSTPCTQEAIGAACSSDGLQGDVSRISNPGEETTLHLPPMPDGYIVAVDSDTSAGEYQVSFALLDG